MTGDGVTDDRVTGEKAKAITPEIVQKVADKVYALLLEDLRLERERKRRR